MDTANYQQLIEEKFGIHIESMRTATLVKAIEQRMLSLGVKSDLSYFDLIQTEESELKNLINLMTVNESYFFREDSQLALLVETIVPQVLSQTDREGKIRILSAGCSTGEEAYSIAIALAEKLGSQIWEKVQIFAFDVDSQVIEAAKKGIYGKSSFRNLDEDLQHRYFNAVQGGRKQIDLSLRRQVAFVEQNLLEKMCPQFLQNMDIIFYRNVSIYFKSRTQKRVFEKLAAILKKNGYLFMSATETFAHDIGILNLVERSNCFVFQKTESDVKRLAEKETENGVLEQERAPLKTSEKSNPSELTINSMKEMDTRDKFNQILALLKFEQQTDALALTKLIEAQHPDSSKLKVIKARVLFELNQIDDAKQVCHGLIKKDQWYTWPYLYLALFASFENNKHESVSYLKKVIYIQPSCWPAHYYLAKYHFSNASFTSAAREMRNVMRLLEKNRFIVGETELFLEPLNIEKVKLEYKEKFSQMSS
jgi:chemotaxis protein methyltransferase CheR